LHRDQARNVENSRDNAAQVSDETTAFTQLNEQPVKNPAYRPARLHGDYRVT
jgi:hypothetical protein